MEFIISEAYFKIFKCIESSNYFQLTGSVPNMLENFKKLYGEEQEYIQLMHHYKTRLQEFESKTNV